MKLTSLGRHDVSVSKSARRVAELLVAQHRLKTPVTAADIVAETGMTVDEARAALAYLAVRNSARVTWKGDHEAYLFDEVIVDIESVAPGAAKSIVRYGVDLLATQAAYFMGALAALGPTFVGSAMVIQGWPTKDPFALLAGGTLALGSAALTLKALVRSLVLYLPVLVAVGLGLGWDRWTQNDMYWIPLLVFGAIAMQLDMIRHFRRTRPEQALRTVFWGRGFSSPLSDRKRLVQLIVAQKGVVTTGDLMRVFGWTSPQAGEQLSGVLLEYGGDVALDDDSGQLLLRFPELADAGSLDTPKPTAAYDRERNPPTPFEGLELQWVVIITVISLVGLFASPLNSSYVELVSEIDLTLQGIGITIRRALAGLFTIPLFVYASRLIFNLMDRSEFGERRRFLDGLEFADRNAKGSLVAPDKFTARELAELNAEVDVERGIDGAMWVSFPDLVRPSFRRHDQDVLDRLAQTFDDEVVLDPASATSVDEKVSLDLDATDEVPAVEDQTTTEHVAAQRSQWR